MLNRRTCCRVLCALLWVLCSAPLTGAGADEPPVVPLEDITITERPIIEGNRTDAFGSVKTVITEVQMDNLNAQDLATALRMTPGISMSRYNPVGSFGGAEGGGVFIRGMGSSRPGAGIQTLIDGAPMFMSVWNHPLLDLMSIDGSQAIEVYKSPQPQNFGNAFGVINIVPKRKETEGFFTQGRVAYGSHDTRIAVAEHGGNTGGWDYYLGGGYRGSDGHRDNADGELKNAWGRLGRRLSDAWDLSLFTLWNDNYADDPGAEGADPATRQGRYETRAWLTTATLSHRHAAAEGEIKLYRSAGEGDWLRQPTGTAGVTEDLFNNFLYYGVRARETLRLSRGGRLLLGADWDYTEGDYTKEFSDGRTDAWAGNHFDILSPHAALSWQLGKESGLNWVPSVGARFYRHSQYEYRWAPHAGLVVRYGPAEMHVGYSRGVIYPGLEVQVMSEAVMPALGESWKSLSPEIVDHYEAGVAFSLGARVAADLTLFYEDGKDRYVIVPAPPPPPTYANIETYTIKGLEATLNWQPVQPLAFFGGLTLLDTDPSDLPYAADTTISCGMIWRFLERFKLSLDGAYVSAMRVNSQARRLNAENTNRVDSHFLVHGRLGYAFRLPSPGLTGEIYIAGENLTDVNYEYQPGYPMPGRSGMIGIKLAL